MYIDLRNPFGITKDEALWDRVTFERVKELVRHPQAKVVDCSRGANNWGEFRFVTLVIGEYALCVYGHGWHEYKEEYVSGWSVNCANYWKEYKEHPGLNKGQVIRELEAEAPDYEPVTRTKRKSESAYLFSMLAEMGDEDGAYTELQDLGYI